MQYLTFRFPQKHIEKLVNAELMGACIDQKYGGSGHDLLTFTLIIEELSRCCASTGILVSIHNCLYADLVQTYGTSDQIDKFLVPFTRGKIGVFALSEHGMYCLSKRLGCVAHQNGSYFQLYFCFIIGFS